MQSIHYIKKQGQYIGKGIALPFNKGNTICDLFDNQLKSSRNSIAVTFNNLSLTYEQLNRRANQMSNYLKSSGLLSKLSVAIFLKPSLEMIIAILAILKAGCNYIPLDVNYPTERINFMLKDSDSSLIITESAMQYQITNFNLDLINLDLISADLDTQSDIFLNQAKNNELAYMIYTSGSTGVPKGVQIHHLAVINHMLWMHHQFQFNSSDKILLKTPLSFDPSIWEIFIPLLTGSELVIAPAGSHIDPELLIDLISEHQITTIQMVPSILKQFLNSKRITECKSLKNIYVGGESLRPEIKELFFKKLNCRLINLYGPTEATIDITFHEILSSDLNFHCNLIGKPIANTSIYLVNEDGNLASIGEIGEILIGSLSLSTGYHKRETLTKENFIVNPFEPKQYKILYKTGDLARWLPTGELEYIGRNNDQVKINGVRIEPKELVLTILQYKEVSDCIVVKKIDTHGHDYLACYLTQMPLLAIDIRTIKKQLKDRFPAFMLPKIYIIIDKIPLTVNGKKELRPTIGAKKLTLILHPFKPKKEDFIVTDRLKFHEILLYLISNAINFTKEGQVTVSVFKKDNWFNIQITDTGIGIPSDMFGYIFEQYTKLSRSNKHGADFKGVGAGLFLARFLAKLLGAAITVESEVGKGSTFTLSIPVNFAENSSTV